MDNNVLAHYGVLGMKWGVHRGKVNTAYVKSINKQNKLNANVTSAQAKARKATVKANSGASAKYKKLQTKADKFQRKADKKKYGLIPNASKAAELQVKADRAQYKANKYKAKASNAAYKEGQANRKVAKAINRAERWTRRMNNTFNEYDVSTISKTMADKGYEYSKNKAKELDRYQR